MDEHIRENGPLCGNCRYSRGTQVVNRIIRFEDTFFVTKCCFYAPAKSGGKWPVVNEGDWCKEWKARPEGDGE